MIEDKISDGKDLGEAVLGEIHSKDNDVANVQRLNYAKGNTRKKYPYFKTAVLVGLGLGLTAASYYVYACYQLEHMFDDVAIDVGPIGF